jgi:peptidoglycan hydrolase-like protein with peptidoglycan-binding domain
MSSASQPVDDAASQPIGDAELEPRRRRVLPVAGVLVLVAAAVGITYLVMRSSSSGNATSTATVQRSIALVPVTRRNLVETSSYDGTLQYADQRSLTPQAAGTVTAVASAGRTVHRGQRLFSVDGQPTILFYGDYPLYRVLKSGVSSGRDVLMLERNLQALGYTPSGMTIDGTWDADTTTAVDAWESALGLTQDGTVPLGRAVVAPGPVRIQTAASVGDPASPATAVVTTTSAERVATVNLSVSDATVVQKGDPVTVTLPDSTTVAGRVSDVGTDATSSSSSSSSNGASNQNGASSSTSGATITITIAFPNQRKLGHLTTAPITAAFTQERAQNVLAVPTTALLTLADGSYAVEVSNGNGTTRYVRVQPGLFAAGGYVAVTGVPEGAQVVVPQ